MIARVETSTSNNHVEFRPAHPNDTRSILTNIGLCQLEDLLNNVMAHEFHNQRNYDIEPPELEEYFALITSIFNDKTRRDGILLAEESSGDIVSSIGIKLKPEDKLINHVVSEQERGVYNTDLNPRAREDLRNQTAGQLTMWYTHPDWSHKGIGKQEWKQAVEYMKEQGCTGALYYTNRVPSKHFTQKYFPDFILNPSTGEISTMVVYLPFDDPRVQAAMDTWAPGR